MTATERPSDVALSIALQTLDQIGSMTKFGRASVSARSTAIFIRTQLESRDPADPVVSAECWRRAIADIFGGDMIATVELHAIELAKEQIRGRSGTP